MSYVTPGLYKHYKGGLYRVLFTAWESTNERERELLIVYVSLEKGMINVRRKEEFDETVEQPDGEKWPRFKFVSSSEVT